MSVSIRDIAITSVVFCQLLPGNILLYLISLDELHQIAYKRCLGAGVAGGGVVTTDGCSRGHSTDLYLADGIQLKKENTFERYL